MIAAQLQDVSISEGDQFLLYLPGKVQEFRQLHPNATTVQQLPLEFRISISEPEFKETWVQFM